MFYWVRENDFSFFNQEAKSVVVLVQERRATCTQFIHQDTYKVRKIILTKCPPVNSEAMPCLLKDFRS